MFMESKGHSPESVLRGSGVDQAMIEAPDFLMDVRQASVVVRNMINLTGDSGIGFEIGNRTRYMDLGVVGYLVMSARTVGEACRLWADYCNALVGMMLTISVEPEKGGAWSHGFQEIAPRGEISNFCIEELMCMICKLGGELTSEKLKIASIDLAYPPPPHQHLYHEQFNCPIRFNAPRSKITIESPHLDQPLYTGGADFKDVCQQQCDFLIRQINDQGSVSSKIKDILSRNEGDIPSIESVARILNMSGRTLRRHLDDEGCSYRMIISEHRESRTKEYLRSTPLSIKEIAYRVGFQDTESLRRAFKLWTGMTISKYRDHENQL